MSILKTLTSNMLSYVSELACGRAIGCPCIITLTSAAQPTAMYTSVALIQI